MNFKLVKKYKNNEKLFSIFHTPVSLGEDCFKQFPTPGPKGWGLPREGGGMVTGDIEPFIKLGIKPSFND